ncbi:MAG: alanine racemase [Bacteroidetes bacterium CG12_big_fil_rev_8_21_14_0_65_60_17]|nr:MAG: alanine racemase [Bacteroidetes bacterium CG12_big_fil_rev_8_21_14_0_65_60_17]
MPHPETATAPDGTTTCARIHLDNLAHNVDVLRRRAGSVELMAVVKANAYGHGADIVTRALEEAGVTFLAVAYLPEAIKLREAGIRGRILVFAPPLPDTHALYTTYDLEAVVDGERAVDALRPASRPLPVHIKVDTGMRRYGIRPADAPDFVTMVERSPHLDLAGLWTHFADAENPDSPVTRAQLTEFRGLMRDLSPLPCPVHASNSGTIYTCPDTLDPALVTWARVGGSLFGLLDLPAARAELKHVMEVRSPVRTVRAVRAGERVSYGGIWSAPQDTVTATIGAGYADGLPRLLSSRGHVQIGERSYPIVGTVCMDSFLVDLGPDNEHGIEAGQDAILLGENPSAFDIATACHTISYEVTCRISQRVPRLPYIGSFPQPN